MLKDFRSFVLRGNVVDLAVGVVIGAAFSAIVNSFVAGLVNPLIGFVGTGDLAKKGFCVGAALSADGGCLHFFAYGQIISSMISFVLVAAVVFFFVVKPVNSLMAKLKPDTAVSESTRECPKCLSKIPKKASRCAFCTADVESVA